MNRVKLKVIIFCLLFIFAGFLNMNTAKAASANIEISADKNPVTVGDTVYVYINISSDTMFGDVEAYLIYDADILEYKSGVSFITGGSGFLRISDINISEEDDNRKYVLEFKALKVGRCEIDFTGSVMVYEFESGMPMSISSNSYELEVKPAQTASDNAYLASIKISPGELNPPFDKNIYKYSTNVGHDTNKLIVSALPEDENATIRISGNESLNEGDNKVTVTVTAEAGNKKEYEIQVTKESAPEDEINIEPITPDEKHGKFELVRIDNEIFAVYGGKYKLVEPGENVKIPEGYTKTRTIISGISIEVYAPKQLDSDFLLIYAENELGEAKFYRYDKVERTLQRYVDEQVTVQMPENDFVEDNSTLEKYRSNLNKAAIIIAILSTLCVLLMILSVRLYTKARRSKDKKRK
ncbi:cadherin-like protein [Herbinix hemicellulosilytica]|uniref:Cadherin-like beta-sandwich-like domain-containing protein n=1 Tax=Herbinix hemicellulosilytica TaxID=1564487 RepID=A0A0H5SXS4_HERHM|nr:cadherin-like beta sandwich domain-containing protein [Herbinix hemicellulosilytica]RBP59770.1 cadherin-like protein [Herbinix hemicellulosilytica]CRZ35158.1 hypothetical protein HHT355_1960 [Herbinix hemicellulosilytica]